MQHSISTTMSNRDLWIEAILGVGIRICYTDVLIDKIDIEWEKCVSAWLRSVTMCHYWLINIWIQKQSDCVVFEHKSTECILFWLCEALSYKLCKTSKFRPCERDNYPVIGIKTPWKYFDKSNVCKLLYHPMKQVSLLPLQGEAPYPGMRSTEVPDKVANGYRLPKPEYCPEFVWVLQYHIEYVQVKNDQVCLNLFIIKLSRRCASILSTIC